MTMADTKAWPHPGAEYLDCQADHRDPLDERAPSKQSDAFEERDRNHNGTGETRSTHSRQKCMRTGVNTSTRRCDRGDAFEHVGDDIEGITHTTNHLDATAETHSNT
jgi:hypothetical protein